MSAGCSHPGYTGKRGETGGLSGEVQRRVAVLCSGIRSQSYFHPVIGGGDTIPIKGGDALVLRRVGNAGATVMMWHEVNADAAVVYQGRGREEICKGDGLSFTQ